jgi:hypothetical protein
MSSTQNAEAAPRFQVGDWVSFRYGLWKTSRVQVIEDRGPLGVHGGRIYRVRLEIPDAEPTTFEAREEDLESASPPQQSER